MFAHLSSERVPHEFTPGVDPPSIADVRADFQGRGEYGAGCLGGDGFRLMSLNAEGVGRCGPVARATVDVVANGSDVVWLRLSGAVQLLRPFSSG